MVVGAKGKHVGADVEGEENGEGKFRECDVGGHAS